MATSTRKPRREPISRALIETHAIELFEQKGIPSTSINDIVRTTGIAKGTFYLYFKDKTDLIDSVISRYSHEFLDEVIAPHRENIRIRDLARAILAFFNRNRLYLTELRANLSGGQLYPSTRATLQAFAEIVRRFLLPLDGYHITNWNDYTRILLAMILDVCHQAIDGNDRQSPREAEEMLGDLLKRFFSCT